MKRLEELSENQREILKSLMTRKKRGLTISEIKDSLEEIGFEDIGKREINEALNGLINYGAVRGDTQKTEEGSVRRYRLSRLVGSGARNQATLLGKRDPLDTYKFVKRVEPFSKIYDSAREGLYNLFGRIVDVSDYRYNKKHNANFVRPWVVKKPVGVFFILAGIGFLVYSGLSLTGDVISSQASSLDAGFVLSFMLMLIGTILLFKNNKK